MGWLFAKLYDPVMAHAEARGLGAWRRELLAAATGTVLEIGAGTGLNLRFYPQAVTHLYLAEPDPHMLARLRSRAASGTAAPTTLHRARAEALPLPTASVDTLVCTLVLCSVDDPAATLAEARRVLRPHGRLIFVEHAAHADARRRRWQRRFEPIWKRLAHGCHLTREPARLLQAHGFALECCLEADLPGAPFWLRPSVRGVALKTARG